ncbi:MAG: ABC transporter ATP-binding protein [Tissierellia bacterium]|nr:ABC transporter ATP-binding protein [Tissierellia bacterium]
MQKLKSNILNISYLIACVLATLFSIKISYLAGDITNKVVDNTLLDNLFKYLLYLFSWIIIWILLLNIKNFFKFRILKNELISHKQIIFRNILKDSLGQFKKNSSAFYHNLLSNDIEVYRENFILSKLIILDSSILLFGSLFFMTKIHPIFSVLTLLSTLIPFILPKLLEKKLNTARIDESDKSKSFIEYIKESVFGIAIIRDFGCEEKVVSEYQALNSSRLKASKKVFDLRAISNASIMSSGFLSYVILLAFGVYAYLNGKIAIGDIIIASQLSNSVKNPISNILRNINDINSTKLIREKFEPYVKLSSNLSTVMPNLPNGDIEIKNLSFAYTDGKNILNSISLKLAQNKKYLLVGKSGSGKSTFMKLMMKYFDDYQGSIKIGDYDLKTLDNKTWYRKISPVLQETFIFEKPLYYNISFSENYDEKRLLKAISDSGLQYFLGNLPNGVESIISEGAKNISGGEKQRIAIARALYKDSDIIFCDEAFSSLDHKMQLEVEKTILKIKDKTIFSISHSINDEILDLYDRFIIFENGNVKISDDKQLAKAYMEEAGLI